MSRPVPLRIRSNFPIAVFFLLSISSICFAETLTLTTYYPSPFGAYDQLRLVPRAAQAGACVQGTFYYNTTLDTIEFCNASLVWNGSSFGNWTLNGTRLYPTNLSWNVGIGTNNPQNLLTLSKNGEDGISVETASNTGNQNPQVRFSRTRGTISSPAAVQAGDQLGEIEFNYYDGASWMWTSEIGAYAEAGAYNTGLRLTTFNGGYNVTYLDSNGNVGIGTDGPPIDSRLMVRSLPGSTGVHSILHLAGADEPTIYFQGAGNNMALNPEFVFRRSRGTIAAPAVVNSADDIGGLWTESYDGTGWVIGSAIDFRADGAQSAARVPTRMDFETMDTGGTYAERMRLTSSGNLGIATTNPTTRLDINGQLRVRANAGPSPGKVLMDTDGFGTCDWRDITYAP